MTSRRTGEVALVTGAARRLGRAISLALAADGFDLWLHCRTSVAEAESLRAEIESRGGRAGVLVADLADPARARGVVAEAAARSGRLDLLVNNASAFYPTPLAAVDERQWDELMAINLKAPFFGSIEAAARLADGGAIVNLADASVSTPWPDHVPYQVSKAGLVHLTEYLARALAPRIRVNAVLPGPILMPEGATPADQERALRRVPLGRLGAPEDVARAVVFLARDRYVTGACLPVDGGRRLG